MLCRNRKIFWQMRLPWWKKRMTCFSFLSVSSDCGGWWQFAMIWPITNRSISSCVISENAHLRERLWSSENCLQQGDWLLLKSHVQPCWTKSWIIFFSSLSIGRTVIETSYMSAMTPLARPLSTIPSTFGGTLSSSSASSSSSCKLASSSSPSAVVCVTLVLVSYLAEYTGSLFTRSATDKPISR